jgi:allantoinase
MTAETERDLKGYGRRRPFADWPGGSRIAVNFVLNYWEGGERNLPTATPTPKII